MFYAPHLLQVKEVCTPQNDEFGRPLSDSENEKWLDVCNCRCDDNTTKLFKSENGEVYRPNYHVVCSGKHSLKSGVYCRCINVDGSIRGEGVVSNPKQLNHLNYSELWL